MLDSYTLNELQKYLSDCLEDESMQSMHLCGAGSIFNFESLLKKYYGKQYVVTFCNATTALFSLCYALNICNGEIITASYNWYGGVSPFLFFNNSLRFCETELFTIAPESVRRHMNSKTKAVLSVDYNGFNANTKILKEKCRSMEIPLISDSCQSFGSFRDRKPAGYFADFVVLSFTANKTLFAGEGGAILTNDEKNYHKLLNVSQHIDRQKKELFNSDIEYFAPINGRMNPIAALILSSQFKKSLKKLRSKQIEYYQLYLDMIEQGLIQSVYYWDNSRTSTFNKFVIMPEKGISVEDINVFLKYNHFQFYGEQMIENNLKAKLVNHFRYKEKYFNSNMDGRKELILVQKH